MKRLLFLFNLLFLPFSMKCMQESSTTSISSDELERRLCILHEHSQKSTCKNPEITEAAHLFPSESSFTKITHFCPASEKESEELIQKICTQYHKLWWYVTPNTKKFNLEQRLQEKGLKPFPLEAMFCALEGKHFQTTQNNAVTIQRMHHVESNQDWHDIHAEAFNYPRRMVTSADQKPEDPKLEHYGLWHNNQLSSIGSLFIHDDWIGLINLATKKSMQNNKLGLALINQLLKCAQDRGAKSAIAAKNGILLSSDKERIKNIEESLGFQKLFTMFIYYRQ